MKTAVSIACAVGSLLASALLHWLLFRPDLSARPLPLPLPLPDPLPFPLPLPIPPIPTTEESAKSAAGSDTAEVARAAEAASLEPGEAAGPTEGGPRRASKASERSELVLDYRIEDSAALLRLASALDLHFVLLSLDTQPPRTWSIAIDSAGSVSRRTTPPPLTDRFLELPTRSNAGPLRYEGWQRAALALHGLPPSSFAKLALAIPEDRLDRAGRAAVARACEARGLDPTSIVRAVLRPAAEGATGALVVEELVAGYEDER